MQYMVYDMTKHYTCACIVNGMKTKMNGCIYRAICALEIYRLGNSSYVCVCVGDMVIVDNEICSGT